MNCNTILGVSSFHCLSVFTQPDFQCPLGFPHVHLWAILTGDFVHHSCLLLLWGPVLPPLPETSEPQQQVDEAPKILCTPYIKGLSEKIAKVCAPLGVKPVFRPKKTLKRELMQVKNRTPEQKQTGVVYEIPCKDCPEVYVGETKRTLKVRLSEHRQAVKRGDPKNGIAVHVQKTNHCINWEGATVQRRAEGFWLRRTVEAIQIRKATPNMNLDSGLLLPMVWNSILNPHPTLNPHPSPHT